MNILNPWPLRALRALLGASLVLLGACNTVDDAPAEVGAAQPMAGLARPYGAPGTADGSVAWSEATPDDAFFGQFELMEALGDLAEPSAVPSADELDRIEAVFAAHAGHASRAVLEQTMAFRVLDLVLALSDGAPSYLDARVTERGPDAQRAAARAVAWLVRNDNPNADLVAAGLRAAGRSVPAGARAQASRRAQAAAASWLAQPCADCDAAAPSAPGGLDVAPSRRAGIARAVSPEA